MKRTLISNLHQIDWLGQHSQMIMSSATSPGLIPAAISAAQDFSTAELSSVSYAVSSPHFMHVCAMNLSSSALTLELERLLPVLAPHGNKTAPKASRGPVKLLYRPLRRKKKERRTERGSFLFIAKNKNGSQA